MMLAAAAAAVVLAAGSPEPPDPRLHLVELQLATAWEEALERTEAELAENPEAAREMGFDYLRGHLLHMMGRRRSASDAFSDAIGTAPKLEPYSRFRLAEVQMELGHPEVAAGLVTSVVDAGVPHALLREAVRLFVRALDQGGDCRLLRGIDAASLPPHERRQIRLTEGKCALATGQPREAFDLFLELVEEDVHDEVEREAAERLARSLETARRHPADRLAQRLGLAFHQHRDFDQSIRYLDLTLPPRGDPLPEDQFDAAYARVRSYFWQERFEEAAIGYAWLAHNAPGEDRRAQALYQESRCYELLERRYQAMESYRAAYRTSPEGPFAAASLMSMLRLEMVLGFEEDAARLFEYLIDRRDFRRTAARAGLFLAASDLVRGRPDRAGDWLDRAERADRRIALEADYWRGRLSELTDQPRTAIESYARVLRHDAFHPLASAARGRLAEPHLADAARQRGLELAGSDRARDLYTAWLLLGDGEAGARARQRLEELLRSNSATAAWLDFHLVPVRQWPLWEADLREPEEMLLALGIWDHAVGEIGRWFPVSDPSLGFTGSDLLAGAGQTRASILRAELLAKRVPSILPEPLWPEAFRRLLHPLVHRDLLLRTTARFGIDPLLLAALIREESRFDPRALSPASARGLTQFVRPTARRLAADLDLGPISADDLYRPHVSIHLGTAYLAELSQRFRDAPEAVVAAYNAGPTQAEVWRSYCFSSEPEEYFTKVGFRETSAYVGRVLSSWARYRDLYSLPPEEPADGTPGASKRSTTGGSSPE